SFEVHAMLGHEGRSPFIAPRVRHGYCVFRSPFWGPAFSSHLGGAFYGTTSDVAYRVTTTGKEMSLHAFGSGHDGATTVQSPMAVLNRKFYGATQLGGSKRCNSGCGTIFGLTTGGAENVVYPFQGGHDGFVPLGSVIEVKGALYGTTSYGGADDGGTVFKMTGSGTKSILYSFKVAGNDGERPSGNVTDVGGVLYGTTAFGGAKDLGTIFTLNASRKETVLHAFAGGTDGASPNGSLVAVKVSCMARRPVAVNLGKEQSFR
ncbi:MAG: choice-of-anchor tandem repeat GloVer-containing protein, partial [Candidatus Cybelea sp.]